jgi:hypothetical protein
MKKKISGASSGPFGFSARPCFVLLTVLTLALSWGCARPVKTGKAWHRPDLQQLKDEELRLLRRQLARSKAEAAQESINRLIYETQLEVAALRGFPVRALVGSAPLTRATLDRLIDESFARQYQGRAMDFYVWFNRLFGALPPGVDLKKMTRDLMSEQVGGLYDPGSKKLFVRQDYPLKTPLGRMILAHEICHAMPDQNFSLLRMGVEDSKNTDRALAALAVAEGDATLLMNEHMIRYGNPMDLLSQLPAIMLMDQQKLNEAPPVIRDALFFPYFKGMAFFNSLDGRTRPGKTPAQPGEPPAAWRSRVFADPPETTEQILHPEKYLTHERPAQLAPLSADSATTHSRAILGEMGIMLTLETAIGTERAQQAAAGWNGDSLIVADNDPQATRTLTWLTRWDTPHDAEEFAQALEQALSAGEGHFAWSGPAARRMAKGWGGQLEIMRPKADTVRLEGSFAHPAR